MAENTLRQNRGHQSACSFGSCESINVGTAERICSILGGVTLGAYGVSKGGLFGWGLALAGGSLIWRGTSGSCQLYSALGISTAEHSPQASLSAGEGVRVETSVIVGCSPQEAFDFWRQLSNLPQVFRHLREIRETSGNRSHWIADAPLGMTVEWDAEMITARPDEVISWRSLDGANVATAGSVRFERVTDTETRIHLLLRYSPPAGRIGAALADWLGQSPEQQIQADLQSLKRILESRSNTSGDSGRRVEDAYRSDGQARESESRESRSGDSSSQGKLHIGDMVWDASGTRRGKVIGVDQLPMGTIEPSNRWGLTYSVQWEDTHKGEGKLRIQDLRPQATRQESPTTKGPTGER